MVVGTVKRVFFNPHAYLRNLYRANK